MKSRIKYFSTILIILLGLFVITGCVGEDEIEKQSKEDSKLKSEMKVDQISDKEGTLTIQNGKKGNSKRIKITLGEGEEFYEEYSFHGNKAGTAYLVPVGKSKKEALVYSVINGEGDGATMDIPAGEYEIYFEVNDNSLTGTYTVKAKKSEENS